MSWPAHETLRAILDLPGVSGQVRHDIEDHLGDRETIEAAERRETEFVRKLRDDPAAVDHHADSDHIQLRIRLNQAVQSHWQQLIDAGVI